MKLKGSTLLFYLPLLLFAFIYIYINYIENIYCFFETHYKIILGGSLIAVAVIVLILNILYGFQNDIFEFLDYIENRILPEHNEYLYNINKKVSWISILLVPFSIGLIIIIIIAILSVIIKLSYKYIIKFINYLDEKYTVNF